MLRLVFATILLGTFVGANGQEAFHRIFPSQLRDNLFVLGGTQLKDGGYATLNIIVTNQGEADTSRSFVVTKYEKKGDVSWNWKFTLPETNGLITPANCALIQAANDSLYFTLVTERTDAPALILGSISSAGKLGKIKTVSTLKEAYDFSSTLGYHLAKGKNSFYSGFFTDGPMLFEAQISKYNNQGLRIFTKGLSAKDTLKNLYQDLNKITNNGASLAFTGIVDSSNIRPYVAVMDTLGTMKWSNTYKDNTFDLGISSPFDVAELKDSSFIIAGVSREIKVSSFNYRGFVLKTTKTGEVDWAKKVVFNETDTTIVKFVETNLQDQIVISGINKTSQGQIYDFLIKLDLSGKVIWQKKYPRAISNGSELGALVATADSGTMLFTGVSDDGLLAPSMIKTNVDGSTTCEEEIMGTILFDNIYTVDTLLWNVRDVVLYEEDVRVDSLIYEYNVPTIRLDPKSFCLKDTVNHLFRSTIAGATNYEWSTGDKGSMLDSLRVMSVGDYSLTVTVGEKVCYELCSDVKLNYYALPTALSGERGPNFCITGKKSIFSFGDAGKGIKSYVWNTGQSGPDLNIIEVSTVGTYIVTITDNCDEQIIATIPLNEFPKNITAATITGSVNLDCFNGTYGGSLTASGNAMGGDALPQKYLWSTGATSSTLEILRGSDVIYTVTVTDICGVTATAQSMVPRNGEGIESVQITTSTDKLCDEGTLRLNAVANRSGTLTYLWTTGEITAAIIVKTGGTYIVTVTDLCANTASQSIEVKPTDFAPEKIRFAKVFFPEGIMAIAAEADSTERANVLLNRTFGPINKAEYCIRGITDYEFYIYNRWGQVVFETKEIEMEWDGRIDGKQSASDTYVYVARYKVNGVELIQKGDVDMIR